ncbi:hypothetical protein RIF29_17627 [Crotalaria pallida]|uniref:Transcription termination factor MTEF18, mitochondrial-like n=1 Tax=Crotalaria pallida TaxID=3830 RepID=A0AAN9IEQ2_CROPI
MISHFIQNHLFLLSPFLFHQKPPPLAVAPQNPSSLSLKVSTFLTFKATHVVKVSSLVSFHSPTSNSSKRVSRVAMAEAQNVLLDYLHSTRGYTFMDAEYISKNSPHFVQLLLSQLENHYDDEFDDDVAGCLRKFLWYNPINEFEPFLESLGILPFELPLFLPHDMMYLSDDYLLLENFHALSNYGIPRNRIGNIYKDAKEVFGYPSDLLLWRFRAYESLGMSRSMVIKLVVCCPSLLVGDMSSELVIVLDWLKKIGIGNYWIENHLCGNYLSCSTTYNAKGMLDSMQFLHKIGYSEKQMHDLFKANPVLLLEGFGNLYLFFGLSLKLGLEINMIYSSFIEYPHILSNKCARNLLRAINFLRFIGLGIDDIAHILSNHMHILSSHPLKGPKTVCGQLKLAKADLYKIIKDDPLKLISLASKLKQDSAEYLSPYDPSIHLEKTTFLMKLGYAENSEEMAKALKRFRGRGDQLQERFDCLVEAGLEYNTAIEMIKRAPMILNQSKVVIEKKIDFLRNTLGYPLECVVGFPVYLCYDLERIFLRFSMYVWVRERNAANPMLALSTILASSDERFEKYFVNPHPEGPTIWEALKRLSHKDKC